MLQNPNDLAQILLIGLPFWLVLTMERNRMPFGRVLAMFPIVPILAVIAHTGSRSALVALAVLGLIVLRNASLVNRIRLGLLGVSLIVVAFAVLPGTTLDRYVTVLGDPGAPETYLSPFEVSTVASSQQRITLFKESVRLTLANPVLGVGPGQFQSYSANDAGRDNKLALWRETHCAYTQISSEAGIPALILYLGAMLYCFKRSYSLYNATRHLPGLRDLGTISYALLLSHVSYAVTALFSSVAYKMFFPTLAAFTVVVLRIADSEMRASQPPASAGTPAAAPATKWFTGRQTRQSRFRP